MTDGTDDDHVAEIVVDCIQSLEPVGDCVMITYGLTAPNGRQEPVLRMLWRGGKPLGLSSPADRQRRVLRN